MVLLPSSQPATDTALGILVLLCLIFESQIVISVSCFALKMGYLCMNILEDLFGFIISSSRLCDL